LQFLYSGSIKILELASCCFQPNRRSEAVVMKVSVPFAFF